MPQVFAVGVSGNLATGNSEFKQYGQMAAKFIEAAMVKAVNDCYAAGVTDPEEVRAHMMAAREAAKQHLRDLAKAPSE
jgi:beta-lactamase regulating signal transducer with metallopeptidase domain